MHCTPAIAKYVTHKAPFMTPVELEISNAGLVADPSKARNELGLPNRPIEETLRDAVSWFVQNGYITNKAVCRKFELTDVASV